MPAYGSLRQSPVEVVVFGRRLLQDGGDFGGTGLDGLDGGFRPGLGALPRITLGHAVIVLAGVVLRAWTGVVLSLVVVLRAVVVLTHGDASFRRGCLVRGMMATPLVPFRQPESGQDVPIVPISSLRGGVRARSRTENPGKAMDIMDGMDSIG